MWKYTFNETGGYDCMTGAFYIWKDKKIMFSIDQSEFGQEHCDYNFRSQEAEELANLITQLLNDFDSQTK